MHWIDFLKVIGSILAILSFPIGAFFALIKSRYLKLESSTEKNIEDVTQLKLDVVKLNAEKMSEEKFYKFKQELEDNFAVRLRDMLDVLRQDAAEDREERNRSSDSLFESIRRLEDRLNK